MEKGGKMISKKVNSVQEWLPVDEILENDIIKVKNKNYIKILKIIPINFELKSNLEKEAILNWILKLGWSHKDSKFDKYHPTLTINQMIEVFNGGKINQSNVKVFIDKLDWLNKKFK